MNNYPLLLLLSLQLVSLSIIGLSDTQKYASLKERFAHKKPLQWGERVTGVKTKLATHKKVIALTLDLCGGSTDGCDYRYIDFFEQKKIPATLFVTSLWIKRHPDDFEKLCKNKLFDIENHGLLHRPASMNGKSIYGISGTKNIDELIEEVEGNAQLLEALTGKKPRLYRSGTAYYDEIAVEIINALGYQVVGFNVLGDKGGTASQEEAKNALLGAGHGSLVILHMNRPEKPSALGALEAINILKKQGFEFVKIADYELE